MAKFESSILSIPDYVPADIIRIRKLVSADKTKMALFMNVSLRTYKKWETGQSHPSKPARRLQQILEKNPQLIDNWF